MRPDGLASAFQPGAARPITRWAWSEAIIAVSKHVDQDASAPVLDTAALARLRELDPGGKAGVLQRVLRTYQNSLVTALASFERAGKAMDLDELRRLAHTLKSSSASVGALALSALCAQIEALARDRRAADATPLVERLRQEGQRVLAALGELLV
jgi:HPt (histidine-containing phosphotransfer) domain-containing protein